MKSVTLKLDVKKKLDAYADGKSTNKAIRELLATAETFDEVEERNKRTKVYNIKIDDDLLEKLHKCKKYSSESHSDVIERLLDSQSE